MVYDDGTAYAMGRLILYACAILTYMVLDLSLKGVLWLLYNDAIVPWMDEVFCTYNYEDYNKRVNSVRTNNNTTNNRKDDGVVYCNTNYTGQRTNDVWVENYIDINDPSRGCTSRREPFFNGAALGYEWRWLSSVSLYGWRQKEPPKPPPEPTIIVSEGIKEQLNTFLKEYRVNEINKRLAKLPKKDTKPPKPAEEAPIQQQNT